MQLKSPQYGSTLTLDCYVKTRYTSGGQVRQIRPTLTTTESLKFVFVGLTRAHREALIKFLTTNAAKRVILSDENGVERLGFITSNKINFVVGSYKITRDILTEALMPSTCATYNTEFDFEGEVI